MKRVVLLHRVTLLALLSAVVCLVPSCEKEKASLSPDIQVSSSTLTLTRLGTDDAGNAVTLNVVSNVYWRATVRSEEAWLSVSPAGGTGEVTLVLAASANEGAARAATVVLETFDGLRKEIQVTQNSRDEVIYYLHQDMGKEALAQSVDANFYTQWSKIGIGTWLTRYGGVNTALVDAQNPSQGYVGASGGNNVLFSKPESSFAWGPVGTKDDEYFHLSFGVYTPEGVSATTDLKLYISKDGESWIALPYTAISNLAGWGRAECKYKVTDLSSVYFKLIAARANCRVDDISLLPDADKLGNEVIFQTVVDDGTPVGFEYFSENFAWITAETFGGTPANFPTNELNFTSTNITEAQRDTINKYNWTQELGASYLRPHTIKLGRTRVGGDLISPPFSFIAPYKSINVQVQFDVAMYASAGGTEDLDGIVLEVRHDGTINSQVQTTCAMDVGLWVKTGEELTQPLKTVTATIYGATSRTQFRIRSGVENAVQTQKNKSNRFFFDNFKVLKAE